MDYKALLLKTLGLGEDATDDDIQAAIAKHHETRETREAAMACDPEKEKAAMSAAVQAAVAEALKPIEEKVAALSAASAAHEKADLVAAATREGKVVALGADALAKLSVEELKGVIEKTPVTVPLNALTPTTVKENAEGGEVPEELRKIALNCGVDPEIFKK